MATVTDSVHMTRFPARPLAVPRHGAPIGAFARGLIAALEARRRRACGARSLQQHLRPPRRRATSTGFMASRPAPASADGRQGRHDDGARRLAPARPSQVRYATFTRNSSAPTPAGAGKPSGRRPVRHIEAGRRSTGAPAPDGARLDGGRERPSPASTPVVRSTIVGYNYFNGSVRFGGTPAPRQGRADQYACSTISPNPATPGCHHHLHGDRQRSNHRATWTRAETCSSPSTVRPSAPHRSRGRRHRIRGQSHRPAGQPDLPGRRRATAAMMNTAAQLGVGRGDRGRVRARARASRRRRPHRSHPRPWLSRA